MTEQQTPEKYLQVTLFYNNHPEKFFKTEIRKALSLELVGTQSNFIQITCVEGDKEIQRYFNTNNVVEFIVSEYKENTERNND